jgi:hypothetical protein
MTAVLTNAQKVYPSQTSPRITSQNLKSMKAKADPKPNVISLLRKLAAAMLSDSMIFASELARVSSCKPDFCLPNAHVLQYSLVRVMRARCAECGFEITSVHQLGAESLEMAVQMSHLTH